MYGLVDALVMQCPPEPLVPPALVAELVAATGVIHVPKTHMVFVSPASLLVQGLDESTGALVAVKLTPERESRPERVAGHNMEVTVLMALASTGGVPAVLRQGVMAEPAGATHWFIMPWYPTCLIDWLERPDAERPMTARVAWSIVSQVAQTYKVAHAMGVTHNDLKPDNVFLDADNNVFIGDWNVATDPERRARLTKFSSGMGGTVGYNPPKRNGSTLEKDADAFRLGALMYVILYRQPVVYRPDGVTPVFYERSTYRTASVWGDSEWLTLCRRLMDVSNVEGQLASLQDAHDVSARRLLGSF
jgi:serine/threonine protein kinase